MAKYFKCSFGKTYVEVPITSTESTNSNIICCVDVSGSMGGGPLQNVNSVLKDIYEKTKCDYDILTYDTQVVPYKLSTVAQNPLHTRGGTSFKIIFDEIAKTIVANPIPTTFIFMTDGDDTSGNRGALKDSISALKLTMSAMKGVPVTIHVIGFGNVKADFLEGVRTFGTKEGLFKYSTQSVELQNDFNDMFEYAASSREVDIIINGKTYETEENSDTAKILIDEELSGETVIKVKINDEVTEHSLVEMNNVRSIHNVNALNLMSPENEEDVRKVLRYLNDIMPRGEDMMEKMEVDQIKKDISDRMMQFLDVFTQIKGGQINENVKLKLNSLLHKAKFDDMNRKKKLDLRVSKNVDYFKKTDIPGILKGFLDCVSNDSWDEIKAIRHKWVCAYYKEDLFEVMKKSPDNILCLGVLVNRDEEAITNPEKGLKLISLSSTIISFDAFMDAVTETKKQNKQLDSFDDSYCIVGESNEKINAVIPLYIHPEHMKRVRILEGIMLGHLYTQNSYGYDKNQEIGTIKLLHDIITTKESTEWNRRMVNELMKVCQFFVNESEGFKSAYGENTQGNFVKQFTTRNDSQVRDLCIPLTVGLLKGDVEIVALACYYEYIRRQYINKFSKNERAEMVNKLMYGNGETKITVKEESVQKIDDLNYVENSYVEFFHDEQKTPVPIVEEKSSLATRKAITFDDSYVKSLIEPVPDFIKKVLEWFNVSYKLEDNIDIDIIRKELIATLHYNVIPSKLTMSNILTIVDNELQGSMDNAVVFNTEKESVDIVVKVAKDTKSLECFAGLLHKYAPKMYGVFLDAIVDELLKNECEMAKEKLECLLTLKVGQSSMYKHMDPYIWHPLVSTGDICKVIGFSRLSEIQNSHLNNPVKRRVYWKYRMRTVDGVKVHPTNYHGHGNHNPCALHKIEFIGYDKEYYLCY